MKKTLLFFFIILVLLILNIRGKWIIWWDITPFFYNMKSIWSNIFMWHTTSLLGGVALPGGNILSLIFTPIIYVLKFLFIKWEISWIIIWLLSTISCYQFFMYISKSNTNIALTITIFYLFSLGYNYLYVRGLFFTWMIIALIFFAARYLCIYLDSWDKKYLLYTFFISIFWAVTASNPGYYIPALLCLFFIWIWRKTKTQNTKRKWYLQWFLTFLITSFISLFSFVLFSLYNKSILHDQRNTVALTQWPLIKQRITSNLTQTFRWFNWDLWDTWWYDKSGNEYHPFAGYKMYKLFPWQIVSWVIVLLMIYGIIIIDKRYKKWYLFWLTVFIINLFFFKSSAAPFGYIFERLLNNIWAFSMFRSPHQKFGIVFVVSQCLMLYYILLSPSNRRSYRIISLTIIWYSLMMGYFWFNWTLISQINKIKIIPLSYEESAEYINNDFTIKRISLLPYNDSTWTNADFGYEGYSLFYYILPHKQLWNRNDIAFSSYNKLFMDKLWPILTNLTGNQTPWKLIDMMKSLNIDTIIYDWYTDRYPRFHYQENHTWTLAYIKQQWFILDKTFDKISIWRLPEKYRKSEVYINEKISFNKINPTKYIVDIKNLKQNQSLSFLQSFHPEWKLYPWTFKDISCDKDHQVNYSWDVTECISDHYKFFQWEELSYLWKVPVFDNTHKLVNEYANWWTIDARYIRQQFPKDSYQVNPDWSIDVKLVLYFRPQSRFYVWLGISGLTLLSLIMWLIRDSNKRRKTNRVIREIETGEYFIDKDKI